MCKQYSANDGQWATLCTACTYSTLNAESDWLVRSHFGMYVPEGISLRCVICAVSHIPASRGNSPSTDCQWPADGGLAVFISTVTQMQQSSQRMCQAPPRALPGGGQILKQFTPEVHTPGPHSQMGLQIYTIFHLIA